MKLCANLNRVKCPENLTLCPPVYKLIQELHIGFACVGIRMHLTLGVFKNLGEVKGRTFSESVQTSASQRCLINFHMEKRKWKGTS